MRWGLRWEIMFDWVYVCSRYIPDGLVGSARNVLEDWKRPWVGEAVHGVGLRGN